MLPLQNSIFSSVVADQFGMDYSASVCEHAISSYRVNYMFIAKGFETILNKCFRIATVMVS